MIHKTGRYALPALAGFLLLAAGCSPLRLLGPKQQLLSKVQLEGVKQADAERIQALYRQKPNSRFPLPKLAIYQLGRGFYNPDRLQRKLDDTRALFDQRILDARPDSSQVGKLLTKRERRTRRLQLALDKGNAIMRLGEPPVIYDSALTRQTAEQIAIFLKSKGFFRSHMRYTDTLADRRFSLGRLLGGPDSLHRRRVTVTYTVTENAPFHYSQLDYDIADTAVARRVLASQPATLLHVGDQYDEEVIGQERARIEALLKDDGYFDFRQQYITLEADTSYAPTTVRLRTMVASPATELAHPRYTIRRVRFITDAGTVRFGQKRDTIVQDSTYFLAFRHRISTRLLNRKLAIHAGDYYNLTNTQTTQRQISQLDVFRFTTVNYVRVRPRTAEDSLRHELDAVVSASPAKRYQETVEFGGTYVANLPGPFGNLRLKARNPFGGAEVLELGLRAGFEGQYELASNDDEQQLKSQLTTQLGANINLVLPQFLVPWRNSGFLTRYNPRTRISIGYNFVSRPEYTRTNLEGTFDYIWQRSAFHQYVFTPVDLSLVNTPYLDQAFFNELVSRFPNRQAAEFTFNRQFVPSLSFTSLYNSNDFNQTRDARYFRVFAEVGGITRPLYQDLLNKDGNGIRVTDFYRLNTDYRRYHKLGPKSFFVYRLNGGIVQPLRPSNSVIPYDKYFFAGGSTSVRAWKPRRLGPGTFTSYVLDTDGVTPKRDESGNLIRNYNIEQPGELLLEGSVEYRFPLFDFINGAVFTDFGNVWALQPDDQRPGAQFNFNRFYQEFAVGSGFGLRFDFTFLILRLDVATKVYDPTAPGSKWAIRNAGLFKSQDQTAFNLGIGYPF
ncbi:BamA/TamA family outer membrane protein [Microvirga sp. STR05]|uniref:BamA/TamA family outer membrane protein n=1 Tax=Hymenobacter duratus TaxID=2771356 RepID=A0ABR8JPE7_9BACT|nr:BamA/TamA family outer membrane protein [Hymenobacter duratus]MBD2716669.1 BamA/TamA family outer membrane protein [Hymenobacter duratus]MBR7951584.1 BamA/TamA family outer membrane protein [Microvirga sp. STR05]